jgi:hypothetical protein
VAAGDFKLKGQYHCVFDMAKTNAGVAAPVVTVRVGTTGTTSDAAILTFTFGAGTALTDSGIFELFVTFKAVGGSALLVGVCHGTHNQATTGLFNNGAVWVVQIGSSTFSSTTATTIGVSFNGGASFAGTNNVVMAQLTQ